MIPYKKTLFQKMFIADIAFVNCAGAMFRYIGILASVETNLSVGLEMQFQIGW